jgi:hypothetical protein
MDLVQKQQAEINSLHAKLEGVSRTANLQMEEIADIKESTVDSVQAPVQTAGANRLHISGEAGVIFRAGEANTNFPNEEFKVDEARLTIEAKVQDGIYVVSELEIFDRENDNPNVEVGELYVEFEDLFGNQSLNLRAGRLKIPFGEEYQNRYVMENPLISHSISDFWGLDEGVEAFGQIGDVSYVSAIMNGSHDFLRDYTSSKSIIARIGYDPANHLHLSGSVMRTGKIDIENEYLTELWFGNGFFRSIGSSSTTHFDVDLAQLDASYSWNNGQMAVSYGQAWYDDNDPLGKNSRDFAFWHIEAKQELAESFFAAIRYSGMNVDLGYPVAGMAARGPYFFGPFRTDQLRRLSLGFTYWPYSDLVLKIDYTMEDGKLTNGSKRKNTDMFAAELGARF